MPQFILILQKEDKGSIKKGEEMKEPGYVLKRFRTDEAGNLLPRPVYARFLLKRSRFNRRMLLLYAVPDVSKGVLLELPNYHIEVQFSRSTAALAGAIGYHRSLYHGQRFTLRGNSYICLSIIPQSIDYHKSTDKSHQTTLKEWRFTQGSLRILRRLPVLGFNPGYNVDAAYAALMTTKG